MTDWLRHLFALVCSQSPAHTWTPGDCALPFCQRCTGLYVGTLLAILVHLVFRPQPTFARRWAYGALLMQMIPLGYHWVPQTALVRGLSGLAFAFGLVGFLTLLTRPARPARWATELAVALAGSVVVLGLAHSGGLPGAWVLSLAGLAGLVILAGLAAINVLLLVRRR